MKAAAAAAHLVGDVTGHVVGRRDLARVVERRRLDAEHDLARVGLRQRGEEAQQPGHPAHAEEQHAGGVGIEGARVADLAGAERRRGPWRRRRARSTRPACRRRRARRAPASAPGSQRRVVVRRHRRRSRRPRRISSIRVAAARSTSSGGKLSSGVRLMRAWRPMAGWRRTRCSASAATTSSSASGRRGRRRTPWRGGGRPRPRPPVTVTSSRRSSSMRSSSSATISRTSSFRRAVRGILGASPGCCRAGGSLVDLHPVAVDRRHLDARGTTTRTARPRRGPRRAWRSVPTRPRHAEPGPLPLVLVARPRPRRRGTGAAPRRAIGRTHGPLVLERAAVGQVEVDGEAATCSVTRGALPARCAYERGISRSSKVSMMSPGLRSWKSERPMPHSKPACTSRTSSLKRLQRGDRALPDDRALAQEADLGATGDRRR